MICKKNGYASLKNIDKKRKVCIEKIMNFAEEQHHCKKTEKPKTADQVAARPALRCRRIQNVGQRCGAPVHMFCAIRHCVMYTRIHR